MIKRSLGIMSLVGCMTALASGGGLAARLEFDTGNVFGPHVLDPDTPTVVQISLTNTGTVAFGVSGVVFDFSNPDGGLSFDTDGNDDTEFTPDDGFVWEPFLDGSFFAPAGEPAHFAAIFNDAEAQTANQLDLENFFTYPSPQGSFTPGSTIPIATLLVTLDPGAGKATLVAGSPGDILTANEDFPQIVPDDNSQVVVFSVDLDHDGDGVPNDIDNCVCTANPSQCDTDGDGIGNHCDADLDNDGVVGLPDFNLFRACFDSIKGDANFDADCDFNCDGAVGIPDFNVFRSGFGNPPGSGCLNQNQTSQSERLAKRGISMRDLKRGTEREKGRNDR